MADNRDYGDEDGPIEWDDVPRSEPQVFSKHEQTIIMLIGAAVTIAMGCLFTAIYMMLRLS